MNAEAAPERLPFEVIHDGGAAAGLAVPAASSAVFAALAEPAALERAVDDTLVAIRAFATPEATKTSYASALRCLCAWHQLRMGQPLALPTPPLVCKLYVLDHFGVPERVGQGPDRHIVLHLAMPDAVDAALVAQRYKARPGRQKMATVDHRLAVLAAAHRSRGLPSPLLDPALRQLLSDCRKTARLIGEGPNKKTAARRELLESLLATCDDSLAGVRDRALLLFGWASGGRRRSEVARAELRDVQWQTDNGERQAIFTMRESKTGDTGPKPIKGEAADALWRWIEQAGLREGSLFRRLHGPTVGAGLSPHAVNEIIKRRAAQAGLDARKFGGHSLRRGFVTEAAHSNIPIAETMRLSGHRLVRTVVEYYEQAEALSSPAADLMARSRAQAGSSAAAPPTPPAAVVKSPVAPGPAPSQRMARIRLDLRVENNSKFVRKRPQAIRAIEECELADYQARKLRDGEYELVIPYENDADLDETVNSLIADIDLQADLYDCFTEASAYEIDGERCW